MQYLIQQSLLDTFQSQIKSIEKYIDHIELINNIPKNSNHIKTEYLHEFNTHLKEFRVSKKEFEYKAIIISLYGVLENTISKWIQVHIQNVSNIVGDYSYFDQKFQSEHFNRSIKLIDMINENRYSKLADISQEQIVKKLNQIIVNPNDFELNSEAYIPLSGNLKHSKIVEAFKPVDIDLGNEKIPHSRISLIDDLVTRRNDIAHGVNIDDAILHYTVLQDYIDALRIYIITIFNILKTKEINYFLQSHKTYIDTIKEIFKNGKVCIVNIQGIELKLGDTLYIHKDNELFEVKILSIQDNDTPLELVNNGEFGLELDKTIKKNSQIWK